MTPRNPLGQATSHRRAGRPTVELLSRERILDEAFLLADTSGGGGFTIAALAKNLDVQAPAIYNYFGSKAELISAMRGQLAQRVDASAFDERPWHEAIRPWAVSYVASLGSHPGTIAALATLPIDAQPDSLDNYERIVASFLRDGYPEALIVPALVACENFIVGSALDALTPETMMSPGEHPERAPLLDSAERAGRDRAATAGVRPAEAAFEFGLAALIAGLRALGRD